MIKFGRARTSSSESISFQKDRAIVDKLIETIRECREIYSNNLSSNLKERDNLIQQKFDALIPLFRERLGIGVRIISNYTYTDGAGPCTITVTAGKNPHGSYRSAEACRKLYKEMEESKKEIEKSPLLRFYYRYVRGYDIDWMFNMTDGVYEQYLALENAISTHGITVDLTNAKIYNAPEGFICNVFLNFSSLVDVKPGSTIGYGDVFGIPNMISDRQIAAIIMHEVGHDFTFIDSISRNYMAKTVFQDVLYDQVKNTRNVKKSYLMAYEKAFKDNTISKICKDKSETDTILITSKEVIKNLGNLGGRFHETASNRSEPEANADQFATRFGLGPEIASALAVWFSGHSRHLILKRHFLYTIPQTLLSLFYIGNIFALLKNLLLGNWYFALRPFYILFYGTLNIIQFYVLLMFLKPKLKTIQYPYDDDFTRISRIKRDLIRILRTDNVFLTDGDKRAILDQVEKLQSTEEHMKKWRLDEETFFKMKTPILDFFSPMSKDISTIGAFHDNLEAIMENELHADSIKLIMGDK